MLMLAHIGIWEIGGEICDLSGRLAFIYATRREPQVQILFSELMRKYNNPTIITWNEIKKQNSTNILK